CVMMQSPCAETDCGDDTKHDHGLRARLAATLRVGESVGCKYQVPPLDTQRCRRTKKAGEPFFLVAGTWTMTSAVLPSLACTATLTRGGEGWSDRSGGGCCWSQRGTSSTREGSTNCLICSTSRASQAWATLLPRDRNWLGNSEGNRKGTRATRRTAAP